MKQLKDQNKEVAGDDDYDDDYIAMRRMLLSV